MTLNELAGLLNKVGGEVGGEAMVCIQRGDGAGPFDEASLVLVREMILMLETVQVTIPPTRAVSTLKKGELYFPGDWANEYAAGKHKAVKVVVIESNP